MTLAVAEMYVQGVSARKFTRVVKQLCGLQVTFAQVSRAAAALDEELAAWRNRPLDEVTSLTLDARYAKGLTATVATTRPPPGLQPGSNRTSPRPSPSSLSLRSPAEVTNPQRTRTTQQEDQTPFPCRDSVPQRGITAQTHLSIPKRDQRRLGNPTVLPEHESQMTRWIIQAFTEKVLLYRGTSALARFFG